MQLDEMRGLKWQVWLTVICVAAALISPALGFPVGSFIFVVGMLVSAIGLPFVRRAVYALTRSATPVQRVGEALFFWIRRPAYLIAPVIVASYFLVFEPIRAVEPTVEKIKDSYVLKSDKPLVTPEEGKDLTKLLEELRLVIDQKLRDARPGEQEWIDRVVVPDSNTVRIRTVPLNQEEADTYSQTIEQVLDEAYPQLEEVAQEPEPKEKADADRILKIGRYEVYRPRPHINLGLDLQGGTHIVLQCLPSTTYTFTTPSDQPTYGPEQQAKTREELQSQLLDWMGQEQFRRPYSVDVISPHMLEVTTRTETEERSAADEGILTDRLEALFGTVNVSPPERLLLDADTAREVKRIVDRRINALGVVEATIEVQGSDRLIVEIPNVENVDELIKRLNQKALLEFRLVPPDYELEIERPDPGSGNQGEVRIWHRGGEKGPVVPEAQVIKEGQRVLVGRDLKPESKAVPDQESVGYWAVQFELKEDEKKAFHALTRQHVGDYMAILLDGDVIMAPVIESPLPGSGVITGRFEQEEAIGLKVVLNSGALPVPIEIAQNLTVTPTLGADTIQRSTRAALLGICLVLAFMIAYYRLPGLLADIALALYVLFVLAVYSFIGATLTLPGIAAFVLSIGMAVDANIIIFERFKEELATQKTMRSAVDAGFDRAWTAILDANVTTLLVAAVLYYLGDRLGLSQIRGFAVTLSIGIGCSMFTAIVVTRLFMNMVVTSRFAGYRNMFRVALSGTGPGDSAPA